MTADEVEHIIAVVWWIVYLLVAFITIEPSNDV